MRDLISYVLGLFLLMTDFASSLLGCARLKSEIEVFPVQCEVEVIGNYCPGKLKLPLNRSRFKAFLKRQEVIRDYGDGKFVKLTGCVVKDWKNWQCTSDNPREKFIQTMADGKYRVTIFYHQPPVKPWNTVYVPAWTWWKLYLSLD